jgi:tetratricopeptide (TPR) repeat protein
MQALLVKIFLFPGVWQVVLWSSVAFAQPVPKPSDISSADSLYRAGNWADAARYYEAAMVAGQSATDPMLLKLAHAYEKQGDVAKVLYFLQVYFKRHPEEAVLRKMNDFARANNLSGYETSDLNYFYLFYRQYGVYLLLVMLLLGAYVFSVLLIKSMRRESTSARLKTLILVYFVALLIFINLPEGYDAGITNTNYVFLRTEPSAAAPVEVTLGRGNKVNILGSTDVWWRVFWNNKLYYVRKDTLWLI